MAGSFFLHHCICTSSKTVLPNPMVSCISISRPRRPNPRKNYLRPKFLKTISIPSILPQPPSLISDGTLLLPLQKHSNFPQIDQFPADASASVQIPQIAKISLFKFGFWLAAAFILQTLFTIWAFNSADSEGNYQTSGLNIAGNGKVRVGNKVITDEPTQNKIEEIRIMAREARVREQENHGLDGSDSDFEDQEEDAFGKTGIEKEVNDSLDKLREMLEKNPERFQNLKGDSVMKKPGNESLLFKKKYKYKGSFRDQRDRPKGFSMVEEAMFHDSVLRRADNVSAPQGPKLDITAANKRTNVPNDTESSQQGMNIDVAEHKIPKVQDTNNGSPVSVTADSRDPSILNANEVANHHKKMWSRQRLKQSRSFKKAHRGSEWWEKLPYVLVILMQKSDDGDQIRGLYTLKSSSDTEGELSHIVAFQDRDDATNFCYLLQLHFEDLGDFSIDVVPLSMKELKEAMKSNTKRVIIVQKGQLQLFAGQPISDVEVALRSLMEQD